MNKPPLDANSLVASIPTPDEISERLAGIEAEKTSLRTLLPLSNRVHKGKPTKDELHAKQIASLRAELKASKKKAEKAAAKLASDLEAIRVFAIDSLGLNDSPNAFSAVRKFEDAILELQRQVTELNRRSDEIILLVQNEIGGPPAFSSSMPEGSVAAVKRLVDIASFLQSELNGLELQKVERERLVNIRNARNAEIEQALIELNDRLYPL